MKSLDRIYDKTPGNIIKVVLGDSNAIYRKEIQWYSKIRKKSIHNYNNELRIIFFASSKNMIMSSMTSPQKTTQVSMEIPGR